MTDLFLVAAFFFPRLTLLFCLVTGQIPPNTTPLAADIIGGILAPRLLIAWWLWVADFHPLLIALFAITGVCELLGGGGGSAITHRRRRA